MQMNEIFDVAVCVLTLNEEKNIKDCLNSVSKQFSDIHIVDSGSVDDTLLIARDYGAKIYTNKQKNTYSAAIQRNWALDNLNTKAKWVLFVDADEQLSMDFSINLKKNMATLSKSCDVIRLPLLYRFHSRLVKSMGYPNFHDRVVSRHCRFVAAVGEHISSDFKVELYDCVLLHDFNSLGMRRFVEKQSRYAEYIGSEIHKFNNNVDSEYFSKRDGNGTLKRRVSSLGLLRVPLRFIYQYFIKLGMLEGREGLVVALYCAFIELMIVVASIECDRVIRNAKL